MSGLKYEDIVKVRKLFEENAVEISPHVWADKDDARFKSFFKQEKKRESKHGKFLRRLPCVRCGCLGCIAAHISRHTDKGMATKASDIYTVPLCNNCHTLQHTIGEVSFWRDVEAAKELARYLYSVTGDMVKACSKILRFNGMRP